MKLAERARDVKSIVCMGMDPILERIPLQGSACNVIVKFFGIILEEMKLRRVYPATVKPNSAFYEQYGVEGVKALHEVIRMYKEAGIEVILDAKRGDIGKTSDAYAKAGFGMFGADAMTVAPYMGTDSVGPFVDAGFCYVLLRTSNRGARDVQDLIVEGEPLYMKVAEKILDWKCGAVVGATYIDEMEKISKFFVTSGVTVPFLIPGVGSQGGSAKQVVKVLRKTGNDVYVHRINSSSGITYSYEKTKKDYWVSAVDAIEELNWEIGL